MGHSKEMFGEIRQEEIAGYAMGIDPYDKELSNSDSLKQKLHCPELVDELMKVSEYYGHSIVIEKKRAFIGIDNGVSGSIGIIYDDGTYEFHQTPVKNEQDYTKAKKRVNRIDGIKLKQLLNKAATSSMVVIERPMVNPSRFVSTMSAIRAYEATVVILEDLRLPYEVIDSKSFQKLYLPLGVSGDDLKPASLEAGNRLFPETVSNKHKDRDGMLIAAYCKQKHK